MYIWTQGKVYDSLGDKKKKKKTYSSKEWVEKERGKREEALNVTAKQKHQLLLKKS